ncbi:DUF2125 domain-containing protein [Actibacterium sp. 188UL27-1]|uniref:DUF2125 domain-containing protein n=1 Tax=Actibacterium sp. 188UL27-1 TaxID=2786961 RepID=UPI00195AA584|nr:DUF2125 domain-containing protein [Actibacterium sp. 188UL27-1]MBM7066912.1 DUF2125 domain-containing protein [Actibacterium sp. 188UL27-1]
MRLLRCAVVIAAVFASGSGAADPVAGGASPLDRTAGKWMKPPKTNEPNRVMRSDRSAVVTEQALALVEDDSLRILLTEAGARVTHDGGKSYDLALETQDLVLPDGMLADLAGLGLPGKIGSVAFSATVVMDRPLGLSQSGAIPGQINITAADLDWGSLQLGVTGGAKVDSLGRANGTLTVTTPDLEGALAVLDPDGAHTSARNFVSGLVGVGLGQDVNLDVTIRNGRVSILGITLTTLPPLKLP